MKKENCVEQLIAYLLDVLPEYRAEAETVPMDARSRRYLLRCLMNVWDPRRKLPEAYFKLEQQLLSIETQSGLNRSYNIELSEPKAKEEGKSQKK